MDGWMDDRQIRRFRTCWQSRFLFPDLCRKDRSDSASRVPHELTCQMLTKQSTKIGRTAWPACDHRKKRSSPPVFLKNWLNFLVRDQSEIKILIVRGHRDINTTYFIWIIAKIYLSLRSFETGTLTADNFKKYSTSMGGQWVRGTVRWYWSADTLFWQLLIDHNIDVQLVFSWAPKLARKFESKHWFPCGADGCSFARSVYGQVITKFSGMDRFP